MIEFKRGNLLEADVEALVNTVNTEGVMGKGMALQFKKAFPEMFEEYRKACKAGEVMIGVMHVFRRNSLAGPRYIINFPTKKQWREPSRLEYIQAGLDALAEEIKKLNIQSIAIPPLGCGFGGLNWKDVYPLIEKNLNQFPGVCFQVYPPQDSPGAEKMVVRTQRPEMSQVRAIVLRILNQYCALGYELTLLEVHKLLYFLQESGESLRLRFKKEYYGPYADNLRHVLNLFEGHFIQGFADGRNKPDTKITLLPEALDEAEKVLSMDGSPGAESKARLVRVIDLIEGFESPYGMELLATVHWASRYDGTATDEETAVQSVHSWNDRKRRMMKPDHIRTAWRRLHNQGWIN